MVNDSSSYRQDLSSGSKFVAEASRAKKDPTKRGFDLTLVKIEYGVHQLTNTVLRDVNVWYYCEVLLAHLNCSFSSYKVGL